MNNSNDKLDLEEFKGLIDSRNLSDTEKEKERALILKAREKRFQKRSEEEIKRAKLLQLKYRMLDFINDHAEGGDFSFASFLQIYIDTIYKKRKKFAEDIGVSQLNLSHIINRHREPNEAFLFKLGVHSEILYKGLSGFPKELWPKVYYQDKTCRFLAEQDEWRKRKEPNLLELFPTPDL